jgi:hypothetical protein
LLCPHPCSRDHRTREEKIKARLAAASGLTEAEKEVTRAKLGQPKTTRLYPPHVDVKPGPKVAVKTEWTINRQPTYNDAVRQYSEALRRMSGDELWKEFNKAYGDMFQRDPARGTIHNWDDDDLGQGQLCKARGDHDWVVIGTSMYHTEIKRCARCGEYDPPRKKEK